MDIPSDVFLLVVDGLVSSPPAEIIAKDRGIVAEKGALRRTCSSAKGNTVSRVSSGTTLVATSPVSRHHIPLTGVLPYLHFQ